MNITITDKQKQVYEYYLQHPEDSQKEIAKNVGVSIPTVARTFKNFHIVRKRVNKFIRTASPGDTIGNNGCVLLKRTTVTSNNKWKGKFRCSCGRSFEAIIADVSSGRVMGCGHNKQYFIGEKLGDNGHTLLKRLRRAEDQSKSWIGLFKCGLCGEEFEAYISRIANNSKTSCGCNTMSKGESRIYHLLKDLHIQFDCQKVFVDCINPQTKMPLRFDFYLPDYNVCIEYDGQQHFVDSDYYPDSLDERKYRDNIKDVYCKKNQIRLIRIPYTDFDKLNQDYLNKKLSLDKVI